MALGMPSLPLTPPWHPGRLLLVRATDAISLCRDGSYEKLSAEQGLPHLRGAEWRGPAEARDFVARLELSSRPLHACDNSTLFNQMGQWIQAGTLVVVRQMAEGAGKQTPWLLKQRRVLRSLRQAKSHALRFESRTYRMEAGADLGQIANRDDYEVVGRAEAMRVLDGLAQQALPADASLLQEARNLLTPDWRQPMGPDGLVLLSRITVRQNSPMREAPPGNPQPTSSKPAETEVPAEEEACRPCAALREAKQAEALRQASEDGSPFCADCGPPPAAAA